VVQGGDASVDDDVLRIRAADSATLLVAAATNFVSYRDVSGKPDVRVRTWLDEAAARPFDALRAEHVAEHRRLFRRVSLELPATADSALPTDQRLKRFDGANDPALAGLLFQFGRYLLISSSRPGAQPANLQGLWNASMNPPWDAKYTTNINTQMNYWPAEVTNLAECAEPLFRMIRELTDQGSDVAREHYGARGWVMHQNTDLWRVAAPMDGPSWGAFTTGGAWLATHLWEHYLFSGDREFLREHYPTLKGSVEFFLDFLVPHPRYGWLVTNPSTSPENFPLAPGNDPFFDEVTTFVSPGTSLVAGSTIDSQILNDLFGYVAEAAGTLGVDRDFRERVMDARARLPPMRIGRKGDLQEWLEDWDQREESHRHLSHLYGLYPGRQISAARTPELAAGSRTVLDQRGFAGNGWASAWKAAAWARLGDAPKALANVAYAVRNYTTGSLFSICSRQPQVDGALGMTAAIAEMLVQSHEDTTALLPALPAAWPEGEVRGLRARGGFEIGLRWKGGRLERASVRSTVGGVFRVRADERLRVTADGRQVLVSRPAPGVAQFHTAAAGDYLLAFDR
jgi:alpha-L-fucosidase 2